MKLRFFAIIFLIGVLTACGSNPPEQRVSQDVNLEQAIERLAQDIDKARQNDVQLLSPTWFKTASDYYRRAARLLKEGDTPRDILKAINESRRSLEKANGFAATSEKEIKIAYLSRIDAISAGVPKLYKSEFEIADEDFIRLAKAVERNKLSSARSNAPDVAKVFQKLEVRAIKEHKLGDARKLITEARNKGAKKYVPKTLRKVQQMYQATDKYITKSPHGTEVHKRADDLLEAAQHLHVALSQIKKWERRKLEDILIEVENNLVKLETLASGSSQSLYLQKLGEHFKNLEENIRSRIDSQKFLNQEVANLQKRLRETNSEIENLSIEKRKRMEERQFAEKFNRVRSMFMVDEADIYRQGTNLLVRLKGLNFEVGKSYILPTHYPLLTKLQKAIRLFDTKRAIIEGHTDTTGSTALNKALSQQRADSVKAYLVFNGSVNDDIISSVGYGPDKPIAPNTTSQGRKLNRRIDVLLIPTGNNSAAFN